MYLLVKNKSEDEIHEEIKKLYQIQQIKKEEIAPYKMASSQKPYQINRVVDDSTKNTHQQKSIQTDKIDVTNQIMMSLNNSLSEQTNQVNNVDQNGQETKPIIEFKQVYFKYPHRENYSLFNVSFQIRKGDKISLIGGSGSGKSTIFNLILGFFENYQGTILLDGKDMRLMDLKEIRVFSRWVQQEPFIISESLKENIIFGTDMFSFKRYKSSLGTACCEDVLLKMKEQYITEVAYLRQQKLDIKPPPLKNLKNGKCKKGQGQQTSNRMQQLDEYALIDKSQLKKKQQDEFIEQTMTYKLQELSGGQKQKISLARAIYGQGQIYLFDNATSSLDLKTEKQVFKNFSNDYFNTKTFFQISQRLEPILFSNKLMVINSGRLVEFKSIVPKDKQCFDYDKQ